MKLEVLNVNDSRWNQIVKSFDNYGVHYLNEYVDAFRMHGDGEPLLFYFESDNNRGINVVMKRDINNEHMFDDSLGSDKYFDLRTPYGYGGWLFDNDNDVSDAYKLYIDWCKNNNIICEFVRFSLFDRREDYYGEITPRVHNIVRSLQGNIEDIYQNIERRHRKDLKKTDGLQIIIEQDGNHLDEFLDIYYSTMDRNNAEDEYYFKRDFYEKLNTMKDNIVYFHVLLDGKVISTELVIMDNNNMYSYLGGTNSDYYSYHPNHFIKYEIIKWGNEHHYKNFVLGGGYGVDDGIYLFKKGFAPDGIYQFYTGKKVFNEEVYNRLVDIRKKEGLQTENNMFFPLYRAK